MTTPLLLALYEGRTDDAKALAATQEPTLAESAALGALAACAAHLAAGARVEEPSPDGWRPLHLAAYFGHADVVDLLLASGAAVSARATSAQGNTPLHAALAGRYDERVLNGLLAAGADVNAPDANHVRPMHLAASRGLLDALDRLAWHGARVDEPMPDGMRPADLAESRGHPAAAAWLRGRAAAEAR